MHPKRRLDGARSTLLLPEKHPKELTLMCFFVFFLQRSIWVRSVGVEPMVSEEAGASPPTGEQLRPAGTDLHRQHDCGRVGHLRAEADGRGRGQDAEQRLPGRHEK